VSAPQAPEWIDLGLVPYTEAEAVQLARHREVLAGGREAVFLLEHPKVITLGRQGGRENLHATDEWLREQGIEVVQATRGGNITCHFPGQLVAYPILRIDRRPGGIRRFFDELEEAAVATAAHFGVTATRDPERPGAWVGPRKLCSIGIAVKRWTSYHGLSFNVGPDLSLFELITLCGLKGASPTSLALETGRDIPMHEVQHVFREAFETATHSPLAAG
jgi:lipoyl(octanoyl) transferase